MKIGDQIFGKNGLLSSSNLTYFLVAVIFLMILYYAYMKNREAAQTTEGFAESNSMPDLDIYDRVGGGDGFASGLIYGIMENVGLETAVNYGAAHGALAMTTPGDTSMVSLDEVIKLVENPNARVVR